MPETYFGAQHQKSLIRRLRLGVNADPEVSSHLPKQGGIARSFRRRDQQQQLSVW
jgi:hypothetical protein